jgi:lipopolysaccharide transport system permease protein
MASLENLTSVLPRPSPPDRREVAIIRPARAWEMPNFQEMWAYRELLFILALRDIKVRYKQSAIGILWAVVQPVMSMVVFTLLFGRLAKIPSDGLPYAVFTFVALVPWQLFQRALTQASLSMVNLNSMMSKIYFPRLFAPLASILSGIVDFLIAFAVLLVLMAWFAVYPGIHILFLPVFVLLALLTALAVSLWLSALNVNYRDVGYALPFLAQLWMFVTPVVYPVSLVPAEWRWLVMLNPMAGVIEGFRWSLLGRAAPPDLVLVGISALAMVALLIGGLFYFNHTQMTYADRV